MHGCAKNKRIGLEDIFPDGVHIIAYGAVCHRAFGLAVPAGQTILAVLNVVIDQVQLFDITLRGSGLYALDRLVDQCIGCFTFAGAAHNREKVHVAHLFRWFDRLDRLVRFYRLDGLDGLDGLDRFFRFDRLMVLMVNIASCFWVVLNEDSELSRQIF